MQERPAPRLLAAPEGWWRVAAVVGLAVAFSPRLVLRLAWLWVGLGLGWWAHALLTHRPPDVAGLLEGLRQGPPPLPAQARETRPGPVSPQHPHPAGAAAQHAAASHGYHARNIPAPLREALEEFVGLLCRDFILPWYNPVLNHSGSTDFPDAVQGTLQEILITFGVLLARVHPTSTTISMSQALTMHFREFQELQRSGLPLADYLQQRPASPLHRFAERPQLLSHLRHISLQLCIRIIPRHEKSSTVLFTILHEILATTVLLPLVDSMSDPDWVNQTILAALRSQGEGASPTTTTSAPSLSSASPIPPTQRGTGEGGSQDPIAAPPVLAEEASLTPSPSPSPEPQRASADPPASPELAPDPRIVVQFTTAEQVFADSEAVMELMRYLVEEQASGYVQLYLTLESLKQMSASEHIVPDAMCVLETFLSRNHRYVKLFPGPEGEDLLGWVEGLLRSGQALDAFTRLQHKIVQRVEQDYLQAFRASDIFMEFCQGRVAATLLDAGAGRANLAPSGLDGLSLPPGFSGPEPSAGPRSASPSLAGSPSPQPSPQLVSRHSPTLPSEDEQFLETSIRAMQEQIVLVDALIVKSEGAELHAYLDTRANLEAQLDQLHAAAPLGLAGLGEGGDPQAPVVADAPGLGVDAYGEVHPPPVALLPSIRSVDHVTLQVFAGEELRGGGGLIGQLADPDAPYVIQVTKNDGSDGWMLGKRYGDFAAFYTALCASFPKVGKSQFPVKAPLGSLPQAAELERWLRLLSTDAGIVHSLAYIAFLEPRTPAPQGRAASSSAASSVASSFPKVEHGLDKFRGALDALRHGTWNPLRKQQQSGAMAGGGFSASSSLRGSWASLSSAPGAGGSLRASRSIDWTRGSMDARLDEIKSRPTGLGSSVSLLSRVTPALGGPRMMPHSRTPSPPKPGRGERGTRPLPPKPPPPAPVDLGMKHHLSKTELYIVIQCMFRVVEEVFSLSDPSLWLRQKGLVMLKSVLENTYSTAISRFIQAKLGEVTSVDSVSRTIRGLTGTLWPAPERVWHASTPQAQHLLLRPRTPEQQEATRIAARECWRRIKALDSIRLVVGRQATDGGAMRVFDMLQHRQLNQVLLCTILDVLVTGIISS